ncbi:hypothetical protein MRB53_030592 [Persea americana]|uniref:Uncharacterized protein n=1 Tax=Persea americana TaxID=3435 RepID=A0ACC2KMB2_PERAE|nr:hypothetical protein MRB53_030592 [Persea americana]
MAKLFNHIHEEDPLHPRRSLFVSAQEPSAQDLLPQLHFIYPSSHPLHLRRPRDDTPIFIPLSLSHHRPRTHHAPPSLSSHATLIVQSLCHLIATFSIASPGVGNLITISSLDHPIPFTPTIAATTSVTSLHRSPLATLTLLLHLHPRSAYPHPHPSSSSPSPSPHRPFPSSSRPRLLHHCPVQIHPPTRFIIHLSHHSISPSRRYLSKPSNTSYMRGGN